MPERRYRILHLITRLDLGGAQQNTLFCVANHDRHRFEVGLLSGKGGLLDGDARSIPGADVHLVAYLRHPLSLLWDFIAFVRLWAHLRRSGVDLVHTHSSKAGILGRWAARLAGVRSVVHTVHGWSYNAYQRPLVRCFYTLLERWTASITDRIVVVSECDRDKGLVLGIGRPALYRVLRSGIDLEAHRGRAAGRETLRASMGFDVSDIVVGCLACLKQQKAPLDFLHAAELAYRRDTRLRFFIAGDGELREAAETQIAKSGMRDIVKLLGWRRDGPDLFAAMDVFMLTSLFEGLPRAVLQAMASGVPVVATAVGGTPEVIRDRETGMLVPPARPSAAADALLALVNDPSLARRCVEAAGRRLGHEFDVRRMVHDLDRLYLELLEEVGVAGRHMLGARLQPH